MVGNSFFSVFSWRFFNICYVRRQRLTPIFVRLPTNFVTDCYIKSIRTITYQFDKKNIKRKQLTRQGFEFRYELIYSLNTCTYLILRKLHYFPHMNSSRTATPFSILYQETPFGMMVVVVNSILTTIVSCYSLLNIVFSL